MNNPRSVIKNLYSNPARFIHPVLEERGFSLPEQNSLTVYDISDETHREAAQSKHGLKITATANEQGNILAVYKELRASQLDISINGSKNICILGPNADVKGRFNFAQSKGRIVISGYKYSRMLNLNIALRQDGQRFFLGSGSGAAGANASMRGKKTSIILGDDCSVSWQVWFRTSDMHAIIDIESKSIVSKAKDIVVYPHVWIGQDSIILKGTTIQAGTIIGAKSVVTGTRSLDGISVYAGVPARKIRSNVTWDREYEPSIAMRKRVKKFCDLYGPHASETSRAKYADDDLGNEASSLVILEKKTKKLIRNPRRFIADSKFQPIRALSRFFKKKQKI